MCIFIAREGDGPAKGFLSIFMRINCQTRLLSTGELAKEGEVALFSVIDKNTSSGIEFMSRDDVLELTIPEWASSASHYILIKNLPHDRYSMKRLAAAKDIAQILDS